MSTEYERQRNKNIEANKKLLESLGLDVLCAILPRVSAPAPVAKPRPKPQPKPKPPQVKRKAEQIDGGSEDAKTKFARLDGEDDPTRRRSSRRSAVKVDYNEDKLAKSRQKYLQQQREDAEDTAEDAAGYVGNKLGKRKHDPYVNRQLNAPVS
jgi:E3 ubiquitin-protein ligase UHRF1